MSYPAIVAGLVARLQTVPGLDVVLDYSPTSLQLSTAAYLELDSFQRGQSGQMTAMTYTVACALCVRYQDNEAAERELAALVNPVCAAIDADPQLSGALASGIARISSGDAEYSQIGETWYRVCVILIEVVEKAPFRSGI